MSFSFMIQFQILDMALIETLDLGPVLSGINNSDGDY